MVWFCLGMGLHDVGESLPSYMPIFYSILLAGAVLVRPRMMVNLGMRVWSGWQVFQRVRPLVNSVLRQI